METKAPEAGSIVELEALRLQVAELKATLDNQQLLLEDLRESEEKYRRFFQATRDACFMTSRGGRMLEFNDVMLKLSGYDKREELFELPVTEWYVNRSDRDRLAREIERNGFVRDFPADLRQRDGSIINTLITSVAVRNGAGEVIGFQGTIRDISDLRKAELALRHERDRVRQYLDLSGVMFVVFNPLGEVTLINEKGAETLGYDKTEIIGRNWFENFIPPQVREKIAPAFQRILQGEKEPSLYYENPVLTSRGEERLIAWHNSILKDEQGNVTGLISSGEDITDRRAAEEQLQQSEETSRAMLEAVPDLMFVFDSEGRFLSYKSAKDEDLLMPPEAFIGKKVEEVMPPFLAEQTMIALRRTVETGESQCFEYQLPLNDQPRYFEARMVLKGEQQTLTMVRDITDRRRLEQERLILLEERKDRINELRCMYGITESARRHVSLQEIFTDTLNLILSGWKYPDSTCAAIEMDEDRYQTDNFRGTEWKLTSEIVVSGEWRGMVAVYYLEEKPRQEEGPFLREERELIDQIARILGEAVEHLEAEEEISKFKAISDNAAFGSAILNLRGNILYVNDYLAGLLGYSTEEVVGQPVQAVFDDEQQVLVARLTEEIAHTGEFNAQELWLKHKEGHLIAMLVSGVIISDENGRQRFMAATMIDITVNKKMERQVQQAQKMESIGLLAGGVAHDFNNILTVINGHAEMALLNVPEDNQLHNDLNAIAAAGQRAATLTRQLLAFSRKQVYKPQITNLNSVIANLGKMLRRLIDEDITLETVLDAEVGNIMADTGQIEQILMNLVVNARDAIREQNGADGSRSITIETRQVYLDQDYIDAHPGSNSGSHVCFAVSDTGVGMDEETREKIFEPFFTTKNLEEGTGLGLAMVYGIVKQNQGSIYAYSEAGSGTSIKVYWPCTNQIIPELDTVVSSNAVQGGNEKLLLAEDDAGLRDLISLALGDLGYTVYTAANGEEAIQLLGRGEIERDIDLLITDVVMPKKGGRELVEEITSILPQVKVLYTSGYTDNHIAVSGALLPEMNFLQKPFSVQALANEVRGILDRG